MTKDIEDGMGDTRLVCGCGQTKGHAGWLLCLEKGLNVRGVKPAAVPEAKPEPPATTAHEFVPSGTTAGNTGIELCATCGASERLGIHRHPANPLSPQEERRSVEMFYEAELWIRHSSPILEGGQAWMDREQFSKALDEFINAVPIATPKVVDSKEEQRCRICRGTKSQCLDNEYCNNPWHASTPKVEEHDGEQEPGFRYTIRIDSVGGHRKSYGADTQEEVNAILNDMQPGEVLVSITGPTAKSVDSLSPSEPTRESVLREALKAVKSWRGKDHDEVLARRIHRGDGYVGFEAGIDAAEGAIANLMLAKVPPSEGTESAKSAWNRVLYVLKLRWYQGDFTEASFHIPYAPPVAPPEKENKNER